MTLALTIAGGIVLGLLSLKALPWLFVLGVYTIGAVASGVVRVGRLLFGLFGGAAR